MSYAVSDLKSELTGVLHGTNLNQVEGLDVLINRAARKLVNDVDPIETVRITQITPAIFDQVYDYQCPADLKDDRIIDIRPQVNRTVRDRFFQEYNEEFDLTKYNVYQKPIFTVQHNTGVKSLRIAKNLLSGLLVNAMNNLTENGAWAVGGNASNLSVDNVNYVYGGGSLECDLAAAGSAGYFEVTNQSAVDISRDEDQGSEFLWVYLPDASAVTSVNYRWGSSSTAYWHKTVTEAQDATAFQDGWNLLRFDWASATQVGSPDATAVDYLRVTCNYDGTAMSGFRINQAMSQLGTIYQIEYYSKYLFRTSGGTWQETVTADTNLINLDTSSYNLLFDLVAYFCAQQIQATDGVFDAKYWLEEYEREKTRYIAKQRSQTIQPSQTYYTVPNRKIIWRTRPS